MLRRLVTYMGDVKPSTSKNLSFIQRAAFDNVQGMHQLDKSKFSVTVPINFISVEAEDHQKMNTIINRLKQYTINKSGTLIDFKPVQDGDNGNKVIYFDPDRIKNSEFDDAFGAVNKYFCNKLRIEEKLQEFTYDNWTSSAILECILPGDQKMSSYTQTGHIVHINSRECNAPYKSIIGQVLYDKVPGCTTVVNKGTNIDENDEKFRTFGVELIAGEANYVTTINENGINFTFDITKVYWNSRLSTEHLRVLQKFCKHGAVIYDMFCGVGPFALVAAKRFLCKVYANDLNPESIKWLNHNIMHNKSVPRNISVSNIDAKEFLQTVVQRDLLSRLTNPEDTTNDAHFLMNLPAMAPTFLNCFFGLLSQYKNELDTQQEKQPFKLFVHIYLFTKNAENAFESAENIVREYLNYEVIHILDVHNVRTVSNMKEMMRVSFELPLRIMVNQPKEEPEYKRARLNINNDLDK